MISSCGKPLLQNKVSLVGHIPGAASYFFRDNLDENDSFLPPNILRDRWMKKLGSFQTEEVVSYCGSGVSGAHNVLALQYAGLGYAALYAGSWSDWITRPERPVATGPEQDQGT